MIQNLYFSLLSPAQVGILGDNARSVLSQILNEVKDNELGCPTIYGGRKPSQYWGGGTLLSRLLLTGSVTCHWKLLISIILKKVIYNIIKNPLHYVNEQI